MAASESRTVRRGRRGRLLHAGHRCALLALRTALRARPARPSDRVTILLANAYGIGGTTRTVLNLAGHLAERREVEVLSVLRTRERPLLAHPAGVLVSTVDDRTRARGPLARLLERAPSVLVLPVDRRLHRRVSLRTDVALVRALWRVRGGVLIASRPSLNVLAAAARRPGLAVVATEHMNLAAHRPDMRAELLRCYARVDAAVLLTAEDRDAFRAALGPAPRLEAIPNAVPWGGGTTAALDRPVVVAVGRLAPQKGYDLLLEAFALVAAQRPDWRLRICGSGRLRKRLAATVAERGLGDSVELLGAVADVERELLGASMFVLSSRFEGLPMAMIEAMSKGVPVVAFDCPTGPGEVLRDGRGGVLVPNGDTDALATAILDLIENEPRRRALGAAAVTRAQDFAMSAVGPRWDSLLSELR